MKGSGKKPADLLFIKGSPDQSEELRARLLLGPSGRLFKQALEDACTIADRDCPDYYVTTLVRCRPVAFKHGPSREPTDDEVWACNHHLEHTIAEVLPKQILLLGPIAGGFQKRFKGSVKLYDPQYVLSCGGVGTTQYIEYVRELSEVLTEVIECRPERKRLLRRKQPPRKLLRRKR